MPAILEATIHCDGTADGFARWLPRFRAGVKLELKVILAVVKPRMKFQAQNERPWLERLAVWNSGALWNVAFVGTLDRQLGCSEKAYAVVPS